MKRKGQKGKGKLYARVTEELVADLKGQFGVDAVVFSGIHRGRVSIQLGDSEIAQAILFSGEDIITNKKVAILIAEETFVDGVQEKVLESLQPGSKNIQ